MNLIVHSIYVPLFGNELQNKPIFFKHWKMKVPDFSLSNCSLSSRSFSLAILIKQNSTHSWYGLDAFMQSGCALPSSDIIRCVEDLLLWAKNKKPLSPFLLADKIKRRIYVTLQSGWVQTSKTNTNSWKRKTPKQCLKHQFIISYNSKPASYNSKFVTASILMNFYDKNKRVSSSGTRWRRKQESPQIYRSS